MLHLDFWIGVGVVAGIYGIFTLGLQINVGFTGLLNLGQAGFMAIGAYAMGMLVVDAGWSLWVAMPAAILVAVVAGLLVGLPSLRLRSDYFAIATIAFAEIVRYTFQNAEFAGGIVIGLSQEWATLFVNPRWKPAVGFAILILTLLVLPRGIFGRKRARA